MERKLNIKRQKESPFNHRLESALQGWKTADATKLDKIGKKVGGLFKSLTCREIISDNDSFDRFPTGTDQTFGDLYKKETIKVLGNPGNSDKPIVELIRERSNDLAMCTDWKESKKIEAELSHLLSLRIGSNFHNWIEKNIKTNNNPELQAKIIYLATSIENPFIFINEEVKEIAKNTYTDLQKTENRLNLAQKEIAIARYTTFLNETRYGANCQELNAWGYADEACREALYLIDNPSLKLNKELAEVGKKFNGDLMLFCENQKCFPPQVFFILDRVKKLYPEAKNYVEALSNFYTNHSEGLFSYFGGQLNFTVSGINRIYERLDVISELNKNNQGAYLSLFSGPPSISQKEAELVGRKKCITVDGFASNELKSVKTGGRALLLKNELLPGQNPDEVLVEDPITNIEHKHMQAWLPNDHQNIESELEEENISVIVDKRGSGLYLEGQKKLDYLIWLFKLGKKNPGVIINYDTGVPNWLYVNFVLKGNQNGGYDIQDYFSGLSVDNRKKTYLGRSGQMDDFYSGRNGQTIPSLIDIDQLIPIGLIDTESMDYEYHHNSSMEEILTAFYYIVNPTSDSFREDYYLSSNVKAIINYFKLIVSDRYDMTQLSLSNEDINKYLKGILGKINPEVFHRIIYLFASKANVSVSREGIFFPALCKRIKFTETYDVPKKIIKLEPIPIEDKNHAFEEEIKMGPSEALIINYANHHGNVKLIADEVLTPEETLKLFKEKFNLNIPESISNLLKDKSIHQLDIKRSYDEEGKTYDQDIFFLIGDAKTTMHLHIEKRDRNEFVDFRTATVVKCQDGIDRIVAIQYQKTEDGWVATRFNISANDFADEVRGYNRECVTFPTQIDYPLRTAGFVNNEMIESLDDQKGNWGVDFYTHNLLSNYSDPQPLYNINVSETFEMILDQQKNNFSLQFNKNSIFTFPARFS